MERKTARVNIKVSSVSDDKKRREQSHIAKTVVCSANLFPPLSYFLCPRYLIAHFAQSDGMRY